MSDIAQDTGEDTNFNLLPVLRHYEEKRRYPRIDVRIPAIVTTPDHQVLNARVRNISAEGLQLRCGAEEAAAILPRGTRLVPGAGPLLTLRFDLRVGDDVRPLGAAARVCYVAAKSPEEIALGVEFVKLNLDSKKLLAEYLVECMRPAE